MTFFCIFYHYLVKKKMNILLYKFVCVLFVCNFIAFILFLCDKCFFNSRQLYLKVDFLSFWRKIKMPKIRDSYFVENSILHFFTCFGCVLLKICTFLELSIICCFSTMMAKMMSLKCHFSKNYSTAFSDVWRRTSI